METRSVILAELQSVVEEFTPLSFPSEVDDEMSLEPFRLDSIALTSLFMRLEEQFGFIPSGVLQGIAFPKTVGELIEVYESEAA